MISWLVTALIAAAPLPAPDAFGAQARHLSGPRLMTGRVVGVDITAAGDAASPRTMLVAGCVGAQRCGGEDILDAAFVGCPPPDAEIWSMKRTTPASWRQAAADLRPRVAVLYGDDRGLAAWTRRVLPATRVVVRAVPGRLGPRRAAQAAAALERMSGTRFARGYAEDRWRMLDAGVSWNT